MPGFLEFCKKVGRLFFNSFDVPDSSSFEGVAVTDSLVSS